MILVTNLSKIVIDGNLLRRVAKIVLKGENREKAELSIVLVGSEKIKGLNKKYRGKNKPTDVLSFVNVLCADLGEIIICPEAVKQNSKKYKSDFKKELTRVLVHGILHLIGYNHEKSKKEADIMDKKTEEYLTLI